VETVKVIRTLDVREDKYLLKQCLPIKSKPFRADLSRDIDPEELAVFAPAKQLWSGICMEVLKMQRGGFICLLKYV
jgi:hypothetical protein